MADEKEKKPEDSGTAKKREEEPVGQVYDSRLLKRLGHYLRPYWVQATISTLAVSIKSASDVSGPFLVMVGIDNYFPGSTGASQHHMAHWLTRRLPADPASGITVLAALYLCVVVSAWIFEFIQTYMMQWTGQKIMFDLRRDIFRHMQRMHIGFFDTHAVGRLVTRLTSDVDAINEMFTAGVLAIVDDFFNLTIMAIVMLTINWWLALLAFSVLPLILVATRLFRNHVRESYRRVRTAIARINSFIQEHISGMAVVQLFNREQRAYNDFEAVNEQHMIAFKDTIFAYALYYPAVDVLSSVAIALVIWRGGFGVLNTTVTIGVLAMFIQYSQRFWRPIQDLSDKYNILQAAMAACERIFKLLDTPAEIVSPEHPIEGDGSNRIEFKHVWFTYQKLTPEQQAAVQAATNPALKGHGFSRADVSPKNFGASAPEGSFSGNQDAARMKGTGFSPDNAGRAKMAPGHQEASGHDFSRADEASKKLRALAPAGSSPVDLNSASASHSASMKGTGFNPYINPAQSDGALAPEGPDPALMAAIPNIEWILKDVSFTVEPGQTVAIVGHTGAGKTTLTSLMMRFYDVTAGQILLDGVDLRAQDLLALRKHFAVVLQDPFLFTGTIKDNIRFGNEAITDAELRQAARDVNVLDFIETLPGHFDEPVRERGNSLSTGQKQLINFARALAYNPRILILDEATSSVDTETELRIRGALERMVEGRTSVLIAHRLSTVQRAETILVMHKGQLREMGSHQQLLARRGLYWKLYQLQYKDQELGAAAAPTQEPSVAPAM